MTEAALHRAVAAYLRVALKPPTIWTTIGHGGGGRVRGAQLKAMGVQPGWPDILVIHPMSLAGHLSQFVIGIELKASRGRQSPEQKAIERAFLTAGAVYCICGSVESVETLLRAVKLPMHATTLRRAA